MVSIYEPRMHGLERARFPDCTVSSSARARHCGWTSHAGSYRHGWIKRHEATVGRFRFCPSHGDRDNVVGDGEFLPLSLPPRAVLLGACPPTLHLSEAGGSISQSSRLLLSDRGASGEAGWIRPTGRRDGVIGFYASPVCSSRQNYAASAARHQSLREGSFPHMAGTPPAA